MPQKTLSSFHKKIYLLSLQLEINYVFQGLFVGEVVHFDNITTMSNYI